MLALREGVGEHLRQRYVAPGKIPGSLALVARRGEEIVSYITFYRKEAWEAMNPGYAADLDYATPDLEAA